MTSQLMALVLSYRMPEPTRRLLGTAAELLAKQIIEVQLSPFGNSLRGKSSPGSPAFAHNEIETGARPRRGRTCETLPCRIRMNPPQGKPQPCNYWLSSKQPFLSLCVGLVPPFLPLRARMIRGYF